MISRPHPVTGGAFAASVRNSAVRTGAVIAAQSPRRVLALIVLVQWAVVLALGTAVRHNGWLWYQGGDQIWHYTTAWLLAHGHLPPTGIGYGWSTLLLPFAMVAGPNMLTALPAILLFNVLVLLPIAIVAVYGIGYRLGGRLFGYWLSVLWVAVPIVGIEYTNTGYHARYTEALLPQTVGLTVMSDFPSMVMLAVSSFFCLRTIQERDSTDGILAGLFAGAAIGVKPSNALYLVGVGLALVAARRSSAIGVFTIGLLPSVVALTFWKVRGLGHIPILSSAQPAVRVASGDQLSALAGFDLHKYFNPDWQHFGNQLDLLREHFWSGRVIQWMPIAGAIGLARRSSPAALLFTGWLMAFVFVKWTFPGGATVEDSNLLRMMIPTIPAFLVLLGAIPLLVPGLARALPRISTPTWMSGHAGRVTVVAAVILFAVVPIAISAAATPLGATENVAFFPQIGPARLSPPATHDPRTDLSARVASGSVRLTWHAARHAAAVVDYALLREPAVKGVPAAKCSPPPGASTCIVLASTVGLTRREQIVDRPGKGRWRYWIAVESDWNLALPGGDIYSLGSPVVVTVP